MVKQQSELLKRKGINERDDLIISIKPSDSSKMGPITRKILEKRLQK